MKRASRSKTIWWSRGIQTLGVIGTGIGLITPQSWPDLPPWAYGLAVVAAGMITEVLRRATYEPLENK